MVDASHRVGLHTWYQYHQYCQFSPRQVLYDLLSRSQLQLEINSTHCGDSCTLVTHLPTLSVGRPPLSPHTLSSLLSLLVISTALGKGG